MIKKFINSPRLNTTQLFKKLFFALVLFWGPLGLFIALADEINSHKPIYLDIVILEWLYKFATPTLDKTAIFITDLGSTAFITSLTVMVSLVLYLQQKSLQAVFLIFTAGGAALMNFVLKLIFQRERPTLWNTLVVESSYSFPSGHAMSSSALAFALMALFWHTKWKWLTVVLGTLYFVTIGITRIYLGVHFPSDVLAGWCISLAWVVIIYNIFLKNKVK